ncbi:hypothetical protein AB833_24915 [Chromatiales bacterium (ex Bugula neritina AB1)]|nr:hypothetical protein AB833_24915 [Chromatiales bacterium (ex Bugula neritina AB1)]
MNDKNTATESDPFAILGLDQTATETEIRQKYLQLVKRYPPEADPVKFRQINQAYESARDPLILAQRLATPNKQIPEWKSTIDEQEAQPPLLGTTLLLALGNRPT